MKYSDSPPPPVISCPSGIAAFQGAGRRKHGQMRSTELSTPVIPGPDPESSAVKKITKNENELLPQQSCEVSKGIFI